MRHTDRLHAATILEEEPLIEGKTFWSQGPRLADYLQALLGNIDGNAFGMPTAVQQERMVELEKEADAVFTSLNTFFEETVAELEELLSKHGLPGLTRPEPLKWAVEPQIEAGEEKRDRYKCARHWTTRKRLRFVPVPFSPFSRARFHLEDGLTPLEGDRAAVVDDEVLVAHDHRSRQHGTKAAGRCPSNRT